MKLRMLSDKTIGIYILATNQYGILGVRAIKNMARLYKGTNKLIFYLSSDYDIDKIFPSNITVKDVPVEESHDWCTITNSKFTNMLTLKDEPIDALYYMDADTGIVSEFDDEWFDKGALVGAEHYHLDWSINFLFPFDQNENSTAYMAPPYDSSYTYFQGAFFGGALSNVMNMCKTLITWQEANRKLGIEPPWNDESYLNKYLHLHFATIIKFNTFQFQVSAKAGMEGYLRACTKTSAEAIQLMEDNKDNLHMDIQGGLPMFHNSEA